MNNETLKRFTRRGNRWNVPRAALILAAVGTLGAPLFSSAPARAQGMAPIRVVINGTPINVGSVAPLREGGRVLVPLRGVLEALGATVGFNNATSTVTARRGATTISLRLGSTQAIVNGQVQNLDVPARTINGRTVVPLRFMSEALGATVQYSAPQNAVYISAPNVAPPIVVEPPVVVNPPVVNKVTIRGVVTRDLPNARRFEIRTDSGALITIRSTLNQPAGLRVGNRVELRGQYSGKFFDASNVAVLDNNQGQTTIAGTVVSILNNRRLTLRGVGGRVYTVHVPGGITSTIQPGVSVRATGHLSGNVLQRATLTYTGGGLLPLPGQNIDWSATVVSRNIARDSLVVRWNNRNYTVNYRRPEDFRVGDRVRVRGVYRNGKVNASSIERYVASIN